MERPAKKLMPEATISESPSLEEAQENKPPMTKTLVLLGSTIKRVKRAEEAASASKKSLADVTVRHSEVVQRLGDAQKEKASLLKEMEATRAELRRSQAQNTELKKKAQHSQLALSVFKKEVGDSWVKKEEFLNSAEFEEICSNKAASYFLHGFIGCLAQFRGNGYSEETHPARFLDVNRAMAQMLEADEASHEPPFPYFRAQCQPSQEPPTPHPIDNDRGSGS